MTILGAIVRPDVPPERIPEVARAAEESGLAELWLWEDSFWAGGTGLAAAVLGMTERLRVGVGLYPIPYHPVAVTAMEVAALARLFPGRFLPGFGHGVQEWMGQSGVRPRSPLTLMREYVPALRRLLAGERVTVSGDYVQLDAVQLEFPVEDASRPALHLGAMGPKSMQLTGEVGDGTILVSEMTLADLPDALARIEDGRSAAGRTGTHEITMFLPAAVGDPQATAADVSAWASAGVHRVVLEPDAGEPDPAGFVAYAGREVAPLLS